MKSIEEVRAQIEKHDGQLPSVQRYSDGSETLGSKIRRAVVAEKLQRALEADDPDLARARVERIRAGNAAERVQRNFEHELKFHDETPRALRRMGLEDQEIALMGGPEEWPAVQHVREWLTGSKLFLVLGGRSGAGKTIGAATALMECKEFYRSESFEGWFWKTAWGHFVKSTDLARLSYFGDETRDRVERLTVVKMLVVDDVGAELRSGGSLATLVELIDARARRGVRTIITTNLAQKARVPGEPLLSEALGSRAFRRLTDFGSFAAVTKPTNEATP